MSGSLAGSLLLACAVCFGAEGDPLVEGAKAGVLFLAVVIVSVLGMISAVVLFWARRARQLEAGSQQASLGAGDVPRTP